MAVRQLFVSRSGSAVAVGVKRSLETVGRAGVYAERALHADSGPAPLLKNSILATENRPPDYPKSPNRTRQDISV